MKRKPFAVFLCVLLAAPFFSGCGTDEHSERLDSSAETEMVTQLTADPQIIETTPPEDEKNAFDIIKRLNFYGKQFSFPCLYEQLSDTFTLESPFYSREAGYTQYHLCFQGQKVAYIGMIGEPSDQNEQKEIVALMIEDEQLENLNVDGETCFGSMDRITGLFGKTDNRHAPDEIGFSSLEYDGETVDIAILFDNDVTSKIILAKKGPGEQDD